MTTAANTEKARPRFRTSGQALTLWEDIDIEKLLKTLDFEIKLIYNNNKQNK